MDNNKNLKFGREADHQIINTPYTSAGKFYTRKKKTHGLCAKL
jgi:hypothetical protein